MRKVLALVRAGWLEAMSYRMRSVLTTFSMFAALVPIYYVARAVQPIVADSISGEGTDYFAFIVTGLAIMPLVRVSTGALPGELGGAISSGTFEALLGTPTRISTLLFGLVGYPFLFAVLRSSLVLGFGWAMGVGMSWAGAPLALVAIVLIVFAHTAIGIFGAAMILAFRTTGPLESLVVWASLVLGGVYFPTQAIPDWLSAAAKLLPLSHGLRAFRRALLEPAPSWALLMSDLLPIAAMGVVGILVSLGAFSVALRFSRRTGTLSQY